MPRLTAKTNAGKPAKTAAKPKPKAKATPKAAPKAKGVEKRRAVAKKKPEVDHAQDDVVIDEQLYFEEGFDDLDNSESEPSDSEAE